MAATLLVALGACGPERVFSHHLEDSSGQRRPPPTEPSAAPPALAPSAESGAIGWASVTGSPDPRASSLLDRHTPFQATCGRNDRALEEAATAFAQALAGGGATPQPDVIALGLRQRGSPYVWPRAWALEGAAPEIDAGTERLLGWLGSFRDGGERRCGVGSAPSPGGEVLAVLAVDVLADLDPLPLRAATGSWLSLGATLLVPASGAKVVVLGPSGAPRPVPTSLDGRRIRARFALDRPGRFLIQVLAEVSGGPRPVLEALVFADVEPPLAPAPDPAPGEAAAAGEADPERALEHLLRVARANEQLGELERLEPLDRVARAHARAMRDGGRVGHDVGEGDPATRVARAGILVRSAGENVAHAMSATHAHRSLYASPSHRANMLSRIFDSVGIGVAPDDDGTLWVCQLFADTRADEPARGSVQ